MDVDVVLPCVPATATVLPNCRVICPSSAARSISGMPASRAAVSSGQSAGMAAVYTTSCAPAMFSARWPMTTGMPSARIRARLSDSLLSDPDSA